MFNLLQIVTLLGQVIFPIITLATAFYGAVLAYHFYRFGLPGDHRGWVFMTIYGICWLAISLFGVILALAQ